MTEKVCCSLRLATCTVTCVPRMSRTPYKGLTDVAGVRQQDLYPREAGLTTLQHLQCPTAVCDLGCRQGHRVRKSLGVHCDVALGPQHLLACVIALQGRCVCVLHTLRVHDQQRRACVAPQSLAGRVKLIF